MQGPMLAHTYQEHGHKLKYPVYGQPKLNGHRCIALKKDGIVTLWTRTMKPITTMVHILVELNMILRDATDGTFLDGELYKHGWSLGRTSSAVKKLSADSLLVEFHVYDMNYGTSNPHFQSRCNSISALEHWFGFNGPVKAVESYYIGSSDLLKPFHDRFVKEGYEGLIIRQLDSPYEFKRSYSLMKYKEMLDAEFPVIGVKAGKQGSVLLVVQVSPEVTCDVNMSGTRKSNQKFLTDQSTWQGKQLTVQFQSYTPDGSLEFPVGLQIREDI